MIVLSKEDRTNRNRHTYYDEPGADLTKVKRITKCGDCRYFNFDPDVDIEYFLCGVSGFLIDSPSEKVPNTCPCK